MEEILKSSNRNVPEPKIDIDIEIIPEKFSSNQQATYESVKRVMQEATRQMKLSLMLPMMLANMNYVKRQLAGKPIGKEAIEVFNTFLAYHRERMYREDDERREKASEKAKRRPSYEASSSDEDKPILHDMNFLNDFEQPVINFLQFLLWNSKIIEYFPELSNNFNTYDQQLMEVFEALKKVAIGNLGKTATTQLDLEMVTQEMFMYNIKLKTTVEPLRKHIRRTMLQRVVQTSVNVNKMKKVTESVAIKEVIFQNYLEDIEYNLHKSLRREKLETKRAVAKMAEDVDVSKLQLEKAARENLNRFLTARAELAKILATYDSLAKKREKTMLEMYNAIQAATSVQQAEKKITDALNREYLALKARHYHIVEVYYMNKLSEFWIKIMVKKIENWACYIWKRMEEAKAAAAAAAAAKGDDDEAEEAPEE